jgi:acyl dehydratase
VSDPAAVADSKREIPAPIPLYWDDLALGCSYSTPSRTIAEADVVAFAALTGDFNRVHVDAEYAKASPFGQRIAHGLLVAAISVGLNTRSFANQQMESALMALLETRFKFPMPTFLGDTIAVNVEVIGRKETSRPDRGITVFRRTTSNQRGEIVVESDVTMMIRRRPEAVGASSLTAKQQGRQT